MIKTLETLSMKLVFLASQGSTFLKSIKILFAWGKTLSLLKLHCWRPGGVLARWRTENMIMVPDSIVGFMPDSMVQMYSSQGSNCWSLQMLIAALGVDHNITIITYFTLLSHCFGSNIRRSPMQCSKPWRFKAFSSSWTSMILFES